MARPGPAQLTAQVAAEDRIDSWLALGQHAQAAAELEALVEARPLRERRWAQLMVAAFRCGRQADALRAYQRGRAVLAEQLGLEPGPELQRLEAAVLAHDPALDWRPAPAAQTAAAQTPAALTAEAPAGPALARPWSAAIPSWPTCVTAWPRPGPARAEPWCWPASRARARPPWPRRPPGWPAGLTALWSRCLDAAATPAYWPWNQLLRALPDGPAVRSARRRLDGDVAEEADSVRQFRAYQAVTAALAEAAGGGPALAVIDDLQDADDASLALLQLLAGDLHRMPVLLVVTVRDTGSSRSLGQALGELLRHPGAERVHVTALEPADVAALIERLTAEPPRDGVVSAMMRRTGGNPFFTTELIRLIRSEHRRQPLTAGAVQARDVPGGLSDVLLRRVGRLPDNTQSLLTVAAVAGRELRPALLEQLTGLDAENLLLDLEPAIAAGLVTEAETGWGFRFRHPLIHESLYASVGRLQRGRLHARVAAALEDIASASTADVAQLAQHYLLAGPFGDPARAVRYGREAAAHAAAQGAWQDAIRQLEQVLTVLAPAAAAPPGAHGERCDVLVELGQARRSAGLIREAHGAFEESIGLADQIGDTDRALAAAVAFGAPQLWGPREWGDNDPRLVMLLERQLDRIAGRDPARRVRILATLATELYFDAEAHRGWAYAQQALDAARRLGQPGELGIAVSAYLLSATVTDRVPELRAVIDEMLAGPWPGLAPQVQAIVLANQLTERLRSGELARFDAEFPAVWRLAADVLHSPELQGQLLGVESSRYQVAGDAARAAEIGQRSLAALGDLAVSWHQPTRFCMECGLMLITSTLADHAEQLAARLAQPGHPSVPHLAAPAAALAFAQRGDLGRAREIAARWFSPPPRSWTWIQAVAYWAQVAAALGQPDPAWLYDQLAPHAGQLAVAGAGVDCGGAVDSLLAGLAWRMGRPDEAAERAQAGLALETRIGSPVWISRTTELISQLTSAP